MSPLTFEQLSWAVAVLVPVATLALTLRRDSAQARERAAEERERRAAQAAETQQMRDQLDSLARDMASVLDTLRRMSEESTAHKVAQAATEATLGDHERRITALEHRCETCRVGGTD